MADRYEYDDVSFTIAWVSYSPSATARWSRERSEPEYGIGVDLSCFRREPVSATFEVTVPMHGGFDDFATLCRQDPPGAASAQTLARRVRYGGRKGRRALQRLFARALSVELAYEQHGIPVRVRGKAVMLSESDIRIRWRIQGMG